MLYHMKMTTNATSAALNVVIVYVCGFLLACGMMRMHVCGELQSIYEYSDFYTDRTALCAFAWRFWWDHVKKHWKSVCFDSKTKTFGRRNTQRIHTDTQSMHIYMHTCVIHLIQAYSPNVMIYSSKFIKLSMLNNCIYARHICILAIKQKKQSYVCLNPIEYYAHLNSFRFILYGVISVSINPLECDNKKCSAIAANIIKVEKK